MANRSTMEKRKAIAVIPGVTGPAAHCLWLPVVRLPLGSRTIGKGLITPAAGGQRHRLWP